jgi:hypothetical protein
MSWGGTETGIEGIETGLLFVLFCFVLFCLHRDVNDNNG